MKKKLVLMAAVVAALFVVSCNGKTKGNETGKDSLSVVENDSLAALRLYSMQAPP